MRKLRVDLRNDPNTIEYMIGNLPMKPVTEDELLVGGRQQARTSWMRLATKSVMAKTTNLTASVKQIAKVGGPKKRLKPVDRLRKDKKYLRKLAKDLSGVSDDGVSQAVATSAKDTMRFLRSRQRFWTQAASST